MCPPSNEKKDAAKDSSAEVKGHGVTITFDKVTYSVPLAEKGETLTILDELSGSFVPGKLTALMGPSGSGKSTLLDCLAGRKNAGALSGDILFDGKAPSNDDFKYSVGYVEQFDTLVGELTVENMLHYTAELKLPSSISATERKERVEEVIQMLNLESCRNTVIGNALMRGISGGQAKRVNIGLALITRPPVLFLDEPTSGLDSRTSNEVVELLRSLAENGNRTIICTIHSPSGHAFSRFEELHMIHNGKTIYEGSVSKVQAYFESQGHSRDPDASLPEWLVDLTSDLEQLQSKSIHGDELANTTTSKRSDFAEIYQSSQLRLEADDLRQSLKEASKDAAPKDHKSLYQPPSQFSKLITLLKYRSVAHYQDGEYLGPRFGDKFIFSLLIMSLYWDIGSKLDSKSVASTSTLLFFITALCGFGAAAFVPALNLERKLFYRELADGCYTPATYYFSKFLEEAFIALFTSALFCVIVHFSCSLTGNFGVFFLSYYMTTLIGVILAYAVAAAVPSLEAANALLPTYVTISMYFGGLFIVFDRIPAGWEWFSWTSFMRYSWGALMLNNYQDSETGQVKIFSDENGNLQTVLEFYSFSAPIMGSVGACLGMLAVLLTFFSIIGVLSLIYIRHENR